MLLELNQLRGAREHFERRFAPADFDPQDEDYRVAAPVELSMDIEKVGTDAFRVKGRAHTGTRYTRGARKTQAANDVILRIILKETAVS